CAPSNSTRSNPSRFARFAAAAWASRIRAIPVSSSASGAGQLTSNGMADGASERTVVKSIVCMIIPVLPIINPPKKRPAVASGAPQSGGNNRLIALPPTALVGSGSAIKLHPSRPQTIEAVPFEIALPGANFLDRQGVALASLFERQGTEA